MRPKHNKSKHYASSGFFRGVQSFEELEKKIASLPDNQSKGDAFEVFAEAYLATHRRYDAKEIWPLNAAPSSLLNDLSLGHQDYGVDGLFNTHLGNYNAYQVKFRLDRHPLTWRELSTFMGLADSPNIHQRVLITNCDELPSVINDRTGFFCVRGSDFDRLEPEDFQAIDQWLNGSVVKHEKKSPFPHQKEALDALLPALKEHDRVTAIMACGTGKTLLALWIAEQPQYKRILVLVPSLALMRQTLHEWLKETNWGNMAYLCVCSDPTVKENVDSISTLQSDLDFPVNTNSGNVRQFLDVEYEGIKVVFTTYQSAGVISNALKEGESFDLGIFDEAHKTAGRQGRNFALALEDDNIRLTKRLFLTATPRKYNPKKKTDAGDRSTILSMDNPDVYGPQAFILNFGQAASRKIICPYKVIVSVITSRMVDNELINRGEVLVKGDLVKARIVANQIAMKNVITKYGARKAFTFHKTVKSAGGFTGSGPESISNHLEGYDLYHVNGTMPTARRESVMKGFRRSDKAIISNARCLTEGVDVPAVDMVAFLSPRKSKVDIVQATGRAMRMSPGKKCGYILVPIYVEQESGESIESAVSRANYDEVWDVLQSMQEQDEVLYDLIQQMAVSRGAGEDDRQVNIDERVEIDTPQVTVKELRDSVTVRLLEEFYEGWSVRYGELKSFYTKHGHSDVNKIEDVDSVLSAWVSMQRVKFKKGLIHDSRIRLLNDLSFSWDYRSDKSKETWMEHYEILKKWSKKKGHARMPRTNKEYPETANWVWIQRGRGKRYEKNDHWSGDSDAGLNQEQVDLLDQIGFSWDPRNEIWEDKYKELKEIYDRGGDVNKDYKKTQKNKNWVSIQRVRKRDGDLDEERVKRLQSIGFDFDYNAMDLVPSEKQSWKKNYEQLVRFKEENGHVDIKSSEGWGRTRSKSNPLAVWILVQREKFLQGKLDETAEKLLRELGVDLERQRIRSGRTWEDSFELLKKFKQKNGHTRVPQQWEGDKVLGGWVASQRANYNAGKIANDKIELLESIGFEWVGVRLSLKLDEAEVKRRVEKLKAVFDSTGNWVVKGTDHTLRNWSHRVRASKRDGTISPEIEDALNDIGFEWDVISSSDITETRIEELKLFKEVNGHFDVGRDSEDNPRLARWIYTQRWKKGKGTLNADIEDALNEIGFEWALGVRSSDITEARIEELRLFKEVNGHFNVGRDSEDNPGLSNWISHQRTKKNKGSLPKHIELALNEIGFDFS